ncbi:polysaccharide deacetylase family protein [Streptomyces pinistramenti]|uniref:polysaccharide deacetylase family protein n=1 Tax=Streptomyces pinistramenti TaxID=2884812 RepID=UPI001D08B34F|nr:polysaccharide deacetylase family protein [Streptomyces pinistramenti]MCB5911621.1 polysaccharide deacetylase family protein [Streptomyces pinistramenti]
MHLVRFLRYKSGPRPARSGTASRGARGLAALSVIGLLAAGCGTERAGDQQDNEPSTRRAALAPEARALLTQARHAERAQARKEAVAKRWGLDAVPLEAPEPPDVKPELTTEPWFSQGGGKDLPQAVSRVPTDQKVVFLTLDDGYEKDPDFLRMMDDLKIPYSAFLSDYLAKDGAGYAYFRQAQQLGNGVHNHTLHHRYLPGLSTEDQRTEICGQQDNLTRELGHTPRLFRPPYGDFTLDTLKVAASCGVQVFPLWATEAFPDHFDYSREDQKLHPGDIILSHFRGREDWKATMPDLVRNVLNTATRQGYAVARLEDYM